MNLFLFSVSEKEPTKPNKADFREVNLRMFYDYRAGFKAPPVYSGWALSKGFMNFYRANLILSVP